MVNEKLFTSPNEWSNYWSPKVLGYYEKGNLLFNVLMNSAECLITNCN